MSFSSSLFQLEENEEFVTLDDFQFFLISTIKIKFRSIERNLSVLPYFNLNVFWI